MEERETDAEAETEAMEVEVETMVMVMQQMVMMIMMMAIMIMTKKMTDSTLTDRNFAQKFAMLETMKTMLINTIIVSHSGILKMSLNIPTPSHLKKALTLHLTFTVTAEGTSLATSRTITPTGASGRR